MKLICIAALTALIALGAVTTGARANQGIFATWWDANDTNDNGLGFGFRSKVQIAPLVSFDTRVSWIKFSDDDINVIPIEATGLLRLGMLYAGVGVGYYVFDVNGDQTAPLAPGSATRITDLDNDFGWYAVGGIDIGAGPVGIFGEVKWTQLSTDGIGVVPNVGNAPITLSADGIGFNLGMMFGVPKL